MTVDPKVKVRPGDVQPADRTMHIAHQFEGQPPPTHWLCGKPIRRVVGSTSGRVRGASVCPECARLDS